MQGHQPPTAQIPQGSVIITPTEMYAELRQVHDEIKRVATLIDPALAELREDIADNRNRLEKHDLRIRAIEGRMWFLAGIAATVGGVGGYVASLISL